MAYILGSPRQFLSWRNTLRLSKVAIALILWFNVLNCFFAGPKCRTVSEAGWTFNKSSCLSARYTVLVSKKNLRVMR
ncbi:uncharacterized protein K441DRAFT_672023 [Cenococcum geophilum 1.58]|uniref:Uncharacterized protein n=1 Tax=Cenococcum geophilum 1.58 TaxID=794803 RepID=A0ACC8EK92_9PEZI|nr:hypothetical protein K441DRAFT_672023 [Cenococcum geophilum 1.58]